MATFEEKRAQLVAQCKAVAHMANAIAQVHSDLSEMHAHATEESFVDLVGDWTAGRMETLGDMASNMDIVTDEDEWLTPIFAKAHELWPQKENT